MKEHLVLSAHCKVNQLQEYAILFHFFIADFTQVYFSSFKVEQQSERIEPRKIFLAIPASQDRQIVPRFTQKLAHSHVSSLTSCLVLTLVRSRVSQFTRQVVHRHITSFTRCLVHTLPRSHFTSFTSYLVHKLPHLHHSQLLAPVNLCLHVSSFTQFVVIALFNSLTNRDGTIEMNVNTNSTISSLLTPKYSMCYRDSRR